jgi:predicted small integral membrane protein
MKTIKIALIAGMALFMTFAVIGNVTMPDVGFGALKTAVGMQTTFNHPGAMWRAITAPWLLYTIFGGIVLVEAIAAVLCWTGAARMWAHRSESLAFEDAKASARVGLGLVAAFYFIGWLVFANEWFGMWQSQQLNVLPDAFRDFVAAMLILLVIERREAA